MSVLHFRVDWLIVISMCLVLPIGAIAQDAPSVEIQLSDGDAARASDPIEFSVVTFVSGQSGAASAAKNDGEYEMAINGVSVRPAGMLAGIYEESARCQFQQQGLRRDQRIETPCILYPKSNGIREKLLPSISAMFAKTLILHVQINYMKNDKSKERILVSRVSVLPPIVAVFYGGVVGAFLLALFRGLAPFRHGLSGKPPQLPATRHDFYATILTKSTLLFRAAMVALAWLVLGGISAVMIIILTKASAGGLSPVQIEVKDFVGGVLVGLLSFPVVDWLETRLLASERPITPPRSLRGRRNSVPPMKTGFALGGAMASRPSDSMTSACL